MWYLQVEEVTVIFFSSDLYCSLRQASSSFRRFCMDVKHLPTDLHVLFSDILQVQLMLNYLDCEQTLIRILDLISKKIQTRFISSSMTYGILQKKCEIIIVRHVTGMVRIT